jgi:hypothetical protein
MMILPEIRAGLRNRSRIRAFREILTAAEMLRDLRVTVPGAAKTWLFADAITGA